VSDPFSITQKHKSERIGQMKVAFLAAIFLCWFFTTWLCVSYQKRIDGREAVYFYSRLDPNTASFSSLTRLPGIGPSLANAIMEYREGYGETMAFERGADLLNVKGIGEKKLAAMEEYLCFTELP
jgi:competence ComEA-like helix-hairpin-helix protein